MSGVFAELMRRAKVVMGKVRDTRKRSNATKYDMVEAGMGALSVFTMQEPSFLSHQERLAQVSTSHNFETMFGCAKIPTTTQMRNILDDADPAEFDGLYYNGLEILEARGGLVPFECLDGVLIAVDGTQHHSSEKIQCVNCSTKTHKTSQRTTYHHTVLCATIVAPGVKEAVPLVPEFITPQDGHEKQDCENVAFKRWMGKHKENYKYLNPTILGDDLFSKQPTCDVVLKAGYNFIFVCKPESHKTLYEYLSGAELKTASSSVKKGQKKYVYQYKFMNHVPIRDGDDAIAVNWLEMTEVLGKTGKVSFKNTFITSHLITPDNAHAIGCAGRARWHLENENNNTLKTKGYRFEHNYGHGQRNLSMVLATLSISAFLVHTIMNIVDALYIKAKQAHGSRINFFNMIRAFTSIIIFASWDSLMRFMIKPPDLKPMIGVL